MRKENFQPAPLANSENKKYNMMREKMLTCSFCPRTRRADWSRPRVKSSDDWTLNIDYEYFTLLLSSIIL